MKLTQKELVKISEEVFTSNPEDKFWATEDGNFFSRQSEAIAHAKGQPIQIFERKVTQKDTEEVVDNEVVTTGGTEEVAEDAKETATENKAKKTTKK